MDSPSSLAASSNFDATIQNAIGRGKKTNKSLESAICTEIHTYRGCNTFSLTFMLLVVQACHFLSNLQFPIGYILNAEISLLLFRHISLCFNLNNVSGTKEGGGGQKKDPFAFFCFVQFWNLKLILKTLIKTGTINKDLYQIYTAKIKKIPFESGGVRILTKRQVIIYEKEQ